MESCLEHASPRADGRCGSVLDPHGNELGLEIFVKTLAAAFAAEAARLAPKDTGKGAESMAARIISSRRGVVTAAIGPGRNQCYMMFQELGTSRHPAKPHLRPAVESHGRRAILAIGEFYREELRAFKRSGGSPRRIAA